MQRHSVLYRELVRFIYNLVFKRKTLGYCIRILASKMGIVYIKMAQILAMQDIKGVFTDKDRQDIADIVDSVNLIPVKTIKRIIEANYKESPFREINCSPLGSASVSQVHEAYLKSGEHVVLKVKRPQIEDNIQKDIIQVRKLVKALGFVFGIRNIKASNKALRLLESWIHQEINFENEAYNIQRFAEFADSVNTKSNRIEVPKLYREYCTQQIIVMEYIPYENIKSGNYANEQIICSINAYVKLSFAALFKGLPVVFHGDPHFGNVYITRDNNIGFLDLGLIFELSPEESQQIKHLFLCAWFRNVKELQRVLRPWFYGNYKQWGMFCNNLQEYCDTMQNRPLSHYFMDVLQFCLRAKVCPPDYLFKAAKAFACLGGYDDIFLQSETGYKLLEDEVVHYLIKSGKREFLNLCRNVIHKDYVKIYNQIISITELKI